MPAALLVLALAGAACGASPSESADGIATAGGSADTDKASAKKGSTDPQQAALDFAECMREHGVDMPDPEFSGDGKGMVVIGPTASSAGASGTVSAAPAPPQGFEEAHEACRHHMDGLIQDGQAQMDPEAQDRALKFAQCMRDNGVDMPDPDFSGGGVRIQISREGGLDPLSDTFKKAQEACGSLFGGPGGPGGGGSAGGSSAAVRIGGGGGRS